VSLVIVFLSVILSMLWLSSELKIKPNNSLNSKMVLELS
jgi:hypothetical protein